MQTKITIRNEAQTCYIDIEGTIGVERDGDSSAVATYEAFRREVERIAQVAAQHVVVNIRSTGGDVNDALLIYEALRNLDAQVTTRCYGYTASAATIIAQAATEGGREISANAMYLIHRSMCAIDGNSVELESRAELLKKTDERLAQLYALHSGGDAAEYAALMAENNGEGRWLTAQEAIEAGLADKLIDSVLQPEAVENDDVVESDMPLAKAAKSPAPHAHNIPKQVQRVVHSAVSELLRYLFSRFTYRWNEWMDTLRERSGESAEEREARRAERKARRAERRAKCGQQEENSAQPTPSAEPEQPAPAVGPEPNSSTAGEVKDATTLQPTTSAIALDEGQRLYKATSVKDVEDPLMNPAHSSSNQKAYMDDVKAFYR